MLLNILHCYSKAFLSLCFSGLAVASALVDVSQQLCLGYKEKSGGLRNRKQQPIAQPATCIWPLPITPNPELWPPPGLSHGYMQPTWRRSHTHRWSMDAVWLENWDSQLMKIYPHWDGTGERCTDMARGIWREPCLTCDWLQIGLLTHICYLIFNLLLSFLLYSLFMLRRRFPCTAAPWSPWQHPLYYTYTYP